MGVSVDEGGEDEVVGSVDDEGVFEKSFGEGVGVSGGDDPAMLDGDGAGPGVFAERVTDGGGAINCDLFVFHVDDSVSGLRQGSAAWLTSQAQSEPLQSRLAYDTRDKEWLPMRTIQTWMILATLSLVAVGCVAQREADDLKTLYRNSQEQVVDLQERLAEALARISALQGSAGSESEALANALAERDRLRKALDDAEERLRNAGGVVLPPELDDALSRLAEANPQLMSYDAKRGMVKLRSDLTFALGSADVSARGGEYAGEPGGDL